MWESKEVKKNEPRQDGVQNSVPTPKDSTDVDPFVDAIAIVGDRALVEIEKNVQRQETPYSNDGR